MKNTDFYCQILGLKSPWSVSDVDLDMASSRVVIRVEIDRSTKWFHPETLEPATMHKWTERRWRHLDTCQFEAIIEASVPSVKYRDGSIEEIAVPWADRYQRFTKLLEQAVSFGTLARNGTQDTACTHPAQSASRFAIVSSTPQPGGQVRLTWSSVPGRYYRIESSSTLAAASWSTVQESK